MGDESPIRTLGDYSKSSHEGYRNTIELHVGNNVVPLRSDTIRLVQNGCSFYGLWSEDPNQHLKDFLKLVDLLDIDGDNSRIHHNMGGSYYPIPCSYLSTGKDRRTPQRYPNVPTTSWRIFIRTMDSFQGLTIKSPSSCGRVRKLSPDKSWATIERVAQYEDEGWNDAFTLEEMSFNYENPDVEQLLGIMERKVDTLMKDAISLMGKSKSVFRSTTNKMCLPPTETSQQEEFEHIVMNFIYDQEERIR
ncbi:hypothetical protein Tco_0000579 [Tanacetum coccineum]